MAAKIEAVSEERSVPELHSQYNITRKKGCGCGFDGAIVSETWCELLTNGTQFDAEVAGDTCRDRCATTTETEGSFARDSAYLI